MSNSFTDGVLVLENARLLRRLKWTAGGLATELLRDKHSGSVWIPDTLEPDVLLPGEVAPTTGPTVQIRAIPADAIRPAHEEVEVLWTQGTLEVRRVFRVFPDCPAIETELSLRGRPAASTWRSSARAAGDQANIENQASDLRGNFAAPVLDRLALGQQHVSVTTVQFFDMSDLRNNFVVERRLLPYRAPSHLAGNVLLARDGVRRAGLFAVKLAPCSDTQLASPGCDFVVDRAGAKIVGIGCDPGDVLPDAWTPCYACALGVGPGDEESLLQNLRAYQATLRTYQPQRDFQILLNTWGDRGQDRKIGEAFCRAEIDAGAKLGVTHLMIDDGWQKGRSTNSAQAGGAAPADPLDYWQPCPVRFPRGLEPVVAHARAQNIRLGLWLGIYPHKQYDDAPAHAQVILGLHRRYGIDLFKIDMVNLPDKTSEIRFRAMLDQVLHETHGHVSFNLDVTAQRRGGFHYLTPYGNRFLENRYTDWSNYYPHWTLRNLWQLSRYVPSRFLQIEFLNRWRMAEKYRPDDVLAPQRVPFAYCFALTMFAQPLAWFEATGLPPEAFDLAPLLRAYRDHAPAIHAGDIFPIGREPDGTSWTGFQSCRGKEGHLLILREYNDQSSAPVKLWNLRDTKLELQGILGAAENHAIAVDAQGLATFSLPTPFNFGLWSYRII